jgi:hypothetical protein
LQKGLLEDHTKNEIEFIEALKDTKLIEAIEPGVLESISYCLRRRLLIFSLVEFLPYSDVFGSRFRRTDIHSPSQR